MVAADFIVQPEIDLDLSIATDRHLMRVVGRRSRQHNAALRVYGLTGDIVSLGRFHLSPPPPPAPAAIRLGRRHSGGRALPAGDGFVGVSLVLPHRSALIGDDPFALAPYQVLNRYVRGILEAARIAGLDVYYPGRDVVTVNRRVLAAICFEIDEQGVMLFEAILANTRDFSILPRLIDSVDPDGLVPIQLAEAGATTSLTRELQARLAVEDVADLLRRGFAQQLGLDLIACEPSPLEDQVVAGLAARELSPSVWLRQRQPRPELVRKSSVRTQLGVFDVYLALQQEEYIKDVLFAGDFIADSPGIELLERKLRLCPFDERAVESVITEVFSQPEHFILGVGKLRTITEAILRAV